MPRRRRVSSGDIAYHVMNRTWGGIELFQDAGDYEAFERVLAQAVERWPEMRLCAYCLMPNHFHLVVWPKKAGILSRFICFDPLFVFFALTPFLFPSSVGGQQRRKRMSKSITNLTTLLAAVALLVIVLFGWLVWPTLYRYDHMTTLSQDVLVRTHRLTGKTEILSLSGWSSTNNARSLPAQALSQIQVKFTGPDEGLHEKSRRSAVNTPATQTLTVDEVYAALEHEFELTAEVYNNSDWTLNTLMVNVTITDAAGVMVTRDRQYILSRIQGTGAPATSSEFRLASGSFLIQPGQRSTTSLVGAVGTKQE